MLKQLRSFLSMQQALKRVNIALTRAAAVAPLREVNLTNPHSWEFSGFSQNGEDGILEQLIAKLKKPNKFFLEIGASDGLENNTSWLAIAKKYNGLMIEGNTKLSNFCSKLMEKFNLGVECLPQFVHENEVQFILNKLPFLDPDIFSLDIDSYDYHVLKSLFSKNFRPKICVVEYNSAFGPNLSITIPKNCVPNVNNYYYGVSINAWRHLFNAHGYSFITVESRGINGIFVDKNCYDAIFLNSLNSCAFQENFYQYTISKGDWRNQYEKIRNLPYEDVT
ncbi:MAG TPA: hypothetical protein VFP93_02420 [Gammaproteobacteria bacterium]|nr:hypothetical protein [Gammaproteobacteria bacterium]